MEGQNDIIPVEQEDQVGGDTEVAPEVVEEVEVEETEVDEETEVEVE